MTVWITDGSGVQPNGDHGGGIGRGDSFSVCYRHPDLPGSMITVTFYPMEYDECRGEFVVQRETECLTCTDPSDPGGTEIWSEDNIDDLYETYDSVPRSLVSV